MTLKIYNTMTRKKELFVPQQNGKVKMYVCGPTVYDYIHIGNARPLIFFDIVRGYLEQLGYEVNYVMNITDVDDKIIRKAEQLKVNALDISKTYTEAFYDDLKSIDVYKATSYPTVSDSMPAIINCIQELVNKDFAYYEQGDVYFSTAKCSRYGQLSGQNLDELCFGIRVDVDERKKNPLDFVLWKAAKRGEISWSSPWGQGRPGWHIECSAMAREILGHTLDIHGGGQDLQFPHHECECAQSEALTGQPLAHYWMHNGFIRVNEQKMSKSLGNGVIVRHLRQTYSAQAIRYFMLCTHYRNPLHFTEETMNQAERSVQRVSTAVLNLHHRLRTVVLYEPISELLNTKIAEIRTQYYEKMADDFNTPDAITTVFDWIAEANRLLVKEVVNGSEIEALLELFEEINGVLRIYKHNLSLLDHEIEQMIEQREDARKRKDWKVADSIRDQLFAQGIILEDTLQGMRWRRK